MTAKRYSRPAQPVSVEQEVNRSRFICYLQPVADKNEAEHFISVIREQHPKANHHCWSYIAGNPDDVHQWNFSDDGEPKGSAGQPMLNILCHSDLGNICAVVVRYFGGIKLGTGGLVRAYGSSVQLALAELVTEEVVPTVMITITAGYDQTGTIEQLISQLQLTACDRQFKEKLELKALIESHRIDELKQLLEPVQHLIKLKIS